MLLSEEEQEREEVHDMDEDDVQDVAEELENDEVQGPAENGKPGVDVQVDAEVGEPGLITFGTQNNIFIYIIAKLSRPNVEKAQFQLSCKHTHYH